MEEICHYFKPYKKEFDQLPNFNVEETLGSETSFYNGNKEWFSKIDNAIVIIGVPESRNSTDNKGSSQAPDEIRKKMYSLRRLDDDIPIYDAGNIQGSKVKDRYQALEEALKFFYKTDSTIIVLGGSHELTIPILNVLKKELYDVHLVVGDAMLDVASKEDFTSRNWLHKVLEYSDEEQFVEVDFFGLQNYLIPSQGVEFVEKANSEVYWLGELLGKKVTNIEVLMREADFVSFDFRCIEGQPQWNDEVASPHGISANSACAISRYAGLSDRLKVFGLFETVVNSKNNHLEAVLAGQIVWHFIDGVANRYQDYPAISAEDYKIYFVHIDSLGESLKFYQNPLNNRWWFAIMKNDEEVLVACSHNDYKQALEGVIPNKWLKYSSH